jgi:hypothetical protein
MAEGSMEQITIWYITDNSEGERLGREIEDMGLAINVLAPASFVESSILENEINIFIFDITERPAEEVMNLIQGDDRLASFTKFVFATRKDIRKLAGESYNILHVEYVNRPVDRPLFLLLLEKTIIVERYRGIMKYLSRESESRIETFEELLDINRKKIFTDEKGKKSFEKILAYEKDLLSEQIKLNDTLREFALVRRNELFELNDRIRAEEMLSDLKRREILDAHDVIDAQESVIDHSARELSEAREILDASEKVAEYSRNETIEIYDQLVDCQEMLRNLSMEMENLIAENDQLREQLNQGESHQADHLEGREKK